MNAATNFQLGPLTWVKGEIDTAVGRAEEALANFVKTGDLEQLACCRGYLHQVHGALAIVGLDGATQFTDALQSLIVGMEERKVAAEGASLVKESFVAVRRYLDDIVGGDSNQPLRLLPEYGRIQLLRGEKHISATDLFFPDMSLRPPRGRAAPALSDDAFKQLLRTHRARFQRGLLAWLRDPQDPVAVTDMLGATQQVEATQQLASARAFWWVTSAMLTALGEGSILTESELKQLCARIDQQMRRLLEGSKNVAERMMRDVLYYVAQADSQNELVRQVKEIYRLSSAVPSDNVIADPLELPRRRLRDAIAATEDSWNNFCVGIPYALPLFRDQAMVMQHAVERLGQTDFRRLAQGICNAANWVAEQPSRHCDALALEVATAILLAQNAQENFTHLGADFAHQVDITVSRLYGFLANNPPAKGAEIALLDEMSRRVHERILVGQVAKEININLAQIEQVVDGYFRDVNRRTELASLGVLIRQIIGALVLLGEEAAADTLRESEADIQRFATTNYRPPPAELQRVADCLAALGFFVDAMRHGVTDFAEFSRTLDLALAPVKPTQTELGEETVEQELERTKQDTLLLLNALKEQPTNDELRQQLKQHLEVLKQDANLIADNTLSQQASAMLSALNAGAAPQGIEAATENIFKPQVAAVDTPSAEILKLAQADAKVRDAGLLEIFMAEAKDVLAVMGVNFMLLQSQWNNTQLLTNIRRSFHTLKGSGRMVGLHDLGETAWSVEQVLNLWLRQEQAPTPEIFQMIEEALRYFNEWLVHLKDPTASVPDGVKLNAQAESMRTGGEMQAVFMHQPVARTESKLVAAAASPVSEALETVDLEPLELELLPLDSADTELSAFESVECFDSPDTFVPTPGETLGFCDIEIPDSTLPAIEVVEIVEAHDVIEPVELTQSHGVFDAIEAIKPTVSKAPTKSIPVFDVTESVEDVPRIEVIESIDVIEPIEYIESIDVVESIELPDIGLPDTPDVQATLEETARAAKPGLKISATLFDIFVGEAREHVFVLEQELALLESNPLDATSLVMERAAHTLASISGTVGLADLNVLGRALEHALVRRNDSANLADREALELIRRTIAWLGKMVANVAGQFPVAPAAHLIEALDKAYLATVPTPITAPTTAPAALPSQPPQAVASTRTGTLRIQLPPITVPQAVAPKIETPKLEQPKVETPSINVASVGTPKIDVPQIEVPKIEVPANTTTAGGNVPPAGGIVFDLTNVNDEIDDQVLPIFLEEVAELTVSINENLRAWRAAPTSHEPAHALHRLFHTFKGSARMAGAMTVGAITHAIEARIDQASQTVGPSAELIDDVQTTFDTVLQVIDCIQRGETFELPKSSLTPATRAATMSSAAPAVEALPALVPPAPVVVPAESVAVATLEQRAPLKNVEKIGASEKTAQADASDKDDQADDSATQRTMFRVRGDLIDQLVNEAGELSITRARIEAEMSALNGSLLDLTDNVNRLKGQLRDIEMQAESQIQSGVSHSDDRHAQSEFDPLEFDRFTRLQELTRMMAETVEDVAMVQQNLVKNLDEANSAILTQSRMNRHLQQGLMSVRMVPFASQAERLYRIVRQTAKELGKRANLEIRGAQLELDRTVLDKIGASLEHLLRNAVAHGLETRELRLAAGKPEIGEVTLSLEQEGNEIIITMADDGAGLNFERIRERGIKAGLLKPDEVTDEARLIKLIFSAGFTTAVELSQIAGRGIGMDVVKTAIGTLGGRIEVQSNAGKGSIFRLYIPVTLAVTQVLLLRTGTDLYAVPSSMIEQVLELKESFLSRIRNARQAEWLGNNYPYRYLPHLLGSTEARPEAHPQYWVLLMRSGQRRVAVHIDELLGNHEIVVKSIGQQLARVVGIDGATVLADGRIVLIVNPPALISRARAEQAPETTATLPQVVEPEQVLTMPKVMVVDDSMTVRKTTGRLLAREGYHVLLAKDGADALEQMQDSVPDVLLTDIEMPRMDGFDLTRNVRGNERLKNLPIVMITSRTADKHRKYAYELGVNNYLGKPYPEDELLRLVAEYTRTKRTR